MSSPSPLPFILLPPGLITCYDTRVGESAKETSVIETSHRDPVYWISWLAGKSPFECVSTSTDAQVLWWDVRKLAEPIDSMWVEDKAADNLRMGGSSMEYAGAGGKFLFGSEQGKIVACSRKGKTPADKVGASWDAHSGPIYALSRNAYYPKFYVTVGDWTVKVSTPLSAHLNLLLSPHHPRSSHPLTLSLFTPFMLIPSPRCGTRSCARRS